MSSLAKKLYLPPTGRPHWIPPPSAKVELLYLGWGNRWFARHPIPISRHDGWVYIVIKAGKPTLRLERSDLLVIPDEVLVIDPECASGWTDTRDQRSELLVWMWRNPPHCAECTPSKGGFLRWKFNKAFLQRLQRIHSACRNEVGKPDSWTKQALEQLHLELDVSVVRSLNIKKKEPAGGLQIELAICWLQQNISIQDPVRSLCEYLQISPSTLGRMFRKHVGKSPSFYHQSLKMNQAKALLHSGKMSVKEIAYQLGYRHPNDFSRAFKASSGLLAKTQRKLMKIDSS